ncbi:MAG: hypothetical protein HJJLKODD_02812 [Phycisphaerae bacterium]|nr:hypothetical protein [Phycisphaerae bacterium]
MFGMVRIKSYEFGLLFRYGDFRKLLIPRNYRFCSKLWSSKRAIVEIVNTLETRFEHPLLEVLIRHPAVRERLEVVELNDMQRAIVWKDERLAYILGPGRHAFWKAPAVLRIELFDARTLRLAHDRLDAIVNFAGSSKWLTGVDVADYEEALLLKDGRIVERLGEGRHVFWSGVNRVTWKAVDRREQVADVAGQEIMTSDKVTLRVNLAVVYQVTDALKAVTVVSDYAQALYREAQLALRAAVGTRSLDALLADKESVGGEVRNVLSGRVAEFGVVVRSVGLKDIILPGEMKTILNQVIEAEKSAQANLIKRREETAATRSQVNTAKLLAENPILARMKELEMIQEILAGAKVTFVLGNGELTSQIRRLTNAEESGDD